jgi:hypothetical protein
VYCYLINVTAKYSPYTGKEENDTREFKFQPEFPTKPDNEMAIRRKSKIASVKNCTRVAFFFLSLSIPPSPLPKHNMYSWVGGRGG